MDVTPYPIPAASQVVVAQGSAPQVLFYGISCEAKGGEVFIRLRVQGGDGLSFYPVHLLDGESRADPPFPVGVIIAGDLYCEIEGGQFLVGGAIFARTGS